MAPHSLAAAAVVAALASSAIAQDAAAPEDPTSLWQRMELPAHRALQRVRETPGTTLAPFTTDGCSGGLSDVWRVVADRFPAFAEAHRQAPPWEGCCVTHDRAYHAAGPDAEAELSYAARLSADEALQLCVIHSADNRIGDLAGRYGLTENEVRSAYDAVAVAMYLAVRLRRGPLHGPAVALGIRLSELLLSTWRRAVAPGLTFQVLYLPIPYRYHTNSIRKKTAVNPWNSPSFATNESAYPDCVRSAPLTPAAAGTASARRRHRPSAASRPRTRPTARHWSPASPSSSQSAPSPPPPARTAGPSAPDR